MTAAVSVVCRRPSAYGLTSQSPPDTHRAAVEAAERLRRHYITSPRPGRPAASTPVLARDTM